jgi:hypothetical protein
LPHGIVVQGRQHVFVVKCDEPPALEQIPNQSGLTGLPGPHDVDYPSGCQTLREFRPKMARMKGCDQLIYLWLGLGSIG